MNAIVSFRKCTLSDEELLKKVDELTDNIYKDGKIPTRHIPARPDGDFDLLVGELIVRFNERFKASYTPKPVELPTVEECMERAKALSLYISTEFREQNLNALITYCQTAKI
jgi:hypothetical protein